MCCSLFQAKAKNVLISVPFTDVFQYLHYLRATSQCLKAAGKSAIVYLSAAVSDFYIHPRNMV